MENNGRRTIIILFSDKIENAFVEFLLALTSLIMKEVNRKD